MTYTTDGIIAEANMNNIIFNQPASQNPQEYVQPLWTKGLRCGLAYNKTTWKERVLDLKQ